jgi:hypothetical protein
MVLDASGTGPPLKNLPRANHAELLAGRNLKWVAPNNWPQQHGAIIARLLDKHLDSLTATKEALEAGELKLMPVGR